LSGTPWQRNAHVPAGALERLVPLRSDARDAWYEQTQTRALTGRGAARIRRVARTLADLDDAPEIEPKHVVLAAYLRDDVP
jgi:magnesium chelatase family protein